MGFRWGKFESAAADSLCQRMDGCAVFEVGSGEYRFEANLGDGQLRPMVAMKRFVDKCVL